MVGGKKDKINILSNIESYSGEHTGRMLPALITIIAVCVPALIYLLFGMSIIPLKIAIIVWALWSARISLYILGNEPKRKAEYRQAMYDEYATADDLVKTPQIHEDGLIEYENGNVAYIVTGYTMTYIDDDVLSLGIEDFLNQLKGYDFDIYYQLVADEFKLQNDMSKMKVYKDSEMMKERMDFYIHQDEECRRNALLYRINIVVKTSKYNWKHMRSHLDDLIKSDVSNVFWDVCIADKQYAEDIASRDICMNLNLERMMMKKYKNEEYKGSKVLFYGDEIPPEYLKERETAKLSSRRVVYKEDSQEGV